MPKPPSTTTTKSGSSHHASLRSVAPPIISEGCSTFKLVLIRVSRAAAKPRAVLMSRYNRAPPLGPDESVPHQAGDAIGSPSSALNERREPAATGQEPGEGFT